MKHIAAYALLVLGGKAEPSAADVEKVLKDSGVAADSDKAAALVEALKGKAFHELVAEGTAALSKMGTGSAAPAAGGAATTAAKEEEKPAEEDDDDDMSLGGGLFGDDDDY